jgi:hypothetical protein
MTLRFPQRAGNTLISRGSTTFYKRIFHVLTVLQSCIGIVSLKKYICSSPKVDGPLLLVHEVSLRIQNVPGAIGADGVDGGGADELTDVQS